jgi:hypothetical protein
VGGSKSTHRTQDIGFEDTKISRLLSEESRSSLLPDFLLSLSSESMRTINGGFFEPREVSAVEVSLNEEDEEEPEISLSSQPIINDPRRVPRVDGSCPVVGVDVSSVRVGESEEGFIYSLRGAIVWREESGYNFTRCGPLTFHLNDAIARFLNKKASTGQRLSYAAWSPMSERVLSRLRNTMERWMQKLACSRLSKGILLLDGSLTAGTPDNPTIYLDDLLTRSRENHSTTIGFSKNTRLCFSGRKITRLLDKATPPCLLNIDPLIAPQFPSTPVKLMGRVYVARLAPRGFPFRVDIDRQTSEEEALAAVGQLVRSDLIDQGYPETLRLAHILSTFTANEILAIQRHLSIEYGLRLAPRMSLRRSLFGPYGTSMEAS